MGYCVYILYSPSADSFYKGQTADLKDRICRHNYGYEKATLHGRPCINIFDNIASYKNLWI
ncbi:MAG: GIY-YIG nuclease family protein [Bacteroidales bacterium]